MRYFTGIIVFMALLLFSCNSINHIPATTSFYGVDFSSYSAQGFLFTPKEFRGEYESVGILDVIITAEMNNISLEEKHRGGGKKWVTEEINVAQAVEKMHAQAKAMGADAVMDLRIKNDYIETRPNLPNVPRITLSGFAIRRK